MANQTKTNFTYSKPNPMEIVGELASDLAKTTKNEVQGTVNIAFEQIGIKSRSKPQAWSTEINISQSTTSKSESKVEKKPMPSFTSFTRETREVFSNKQEMENRRVQELVVALSKEVASLKYQTAQISGEIQNITVETVTSGPQTYHISFFETILAMLRDIKKDIVKSRTWLSAFNSKKQKKGYWAMFKKHGTSFAMSDERGIATSAG